MEAAGFGRILRSSMIAVYGPHSGKQPVSRNHFAGHVRVGAEHAQEVS